MDIPQNDDIPRTEKTKLRRLPKRGSYEREVIYQILDEGFVCHVGFNLDNQPFVIPTAYARVDSVLLIHGSQASRMLRALSQGVEVCVTVTLVDGLVMARSAFHHSINYRSVVIFGVAQLVREESEKLAALRAFTEHIAPGRWNQVRPPTEQELTQTTVLSLPLQEASAKVRAGDPIDDEEDYSLDVWAGVIPLRLSVGNPEDDARLKDGINFPSYLAEIPRFSSKA